MRHSMYKLWTWLICCRMPMLYIARAGMLSWWAAKMHILIGNSKFCLWHVCGDAEDVYTTSQCHTSRHPVAYLWNTRKTFSGYKACRKAFLCICTCNPETQEWHETKRTTCLIISRSLWHDNDVMYVLASFTSTIVLYVYRNMLHARCTLIRTCLVPIPYNTVTASCSCVWGDDHMPIVRTWHE